jgi:hypothetical protein
MTNKEQGATMTQGQSEQSAKYKVGDRVLYGRTQCEVAGVRVSVFGWTLYDLKASNGQVLGVPEDSIYLKAISAT